MHFQLFDIDLKEGKVLDTKIADDGIYADAVVEWRGYSRPDHAWMFERLRHALGCWSPTNTVPDHPSRWRLRGAIEAGETVYTLDHGDQQPSAWPTWDALDVQQRQSIVAEMDRLLESLHGLLLIL